MVLHRLSDLGAAGAAGSREARIAEGLIADAETQVIYAQPPDQIESAARPARAERDRDRAGADAALRRGAVAGRAALLPRPAPALGDRARAGRHRRADGRAPRRAAEGSRERRADPGGGWSAAGDLRRRSCGLLWLSGALAAALFGEGWSDGASERAGRRRRWRSLAPRRSARGMAGGDAARRCLARSASTWCWRSSCGRDRRGWPSPHCGWRGRARGGAAREAQDAPPSARWASRRELRALRGRGAAAGAADPRPAGRG